MSCLKHFFFFFVLPSLVWTTPAHAQLILTVDRISDTEAILPGSGSTPSVEPVQKMRFLTLDTVLGITAGAVNPALSANTAKLNTSSLDNVFAGSPNAGGSFPLGVELEFSDNGVGYVFTGSATITLGQGVWGAAGSSGTVLWGGGPAVNAGSWSITGVPEPTSFALFSIAMVGMARRRRVR